jgi:AmpD protein
MHIAKATKADAVSANPDTHSLWQTGWHTAARRVDSPNFGPRPENANIDLIVLHSISLPPGQYGGPEIEAFFTNTLNWDAHPYFEKIRDMAVSAHFVIRRTGELLQFVSCDDRAWHAGTSHYRGRDNCNDDSIGIELEGLEGDTFTSEQYTQLQKLCEDIAFAYPIAHIAGHEHIAPGRKQDPGAGFDWGFLQHNLGWSAHFFPSKTD